MGEQIEWEVTLRINHLGDITGAQWEGQDPSEVQAMLDSKPRLVGQKLVDITTQQSPASTQKVARDCHWIPTPWGKK